MKQLPRATTWWGVVEWACLLLITPLLLFVTPTRAPLLLVIPALWGLRRLILGRFVPRTPVDLPILVLMVMGGVGFCVSPNPAWSQMKIDALLLGVGFLYATVDLLEPVDRLRWVPAGVIVLGLAFLGLGLLGTKWVLKVPQLGALTAGLPGELAWLPEGETTFNPNVIGGALLWVLPLSLSLLFWALQRAKRRWGWATAQVAVTALSLGLLLLTQSRGAWMSFAVSFLTLLTFAGGRVGRIGTALIVTMLLILIAVNPVIRRAIHINDEPASSLFTATLRQRFELWSRAQYAIADFPYTGIGLDAFEHMTRLMYPLFYGSSIPHPHAHNEFLDVAVDLGVPGLIAWQALYIATLWMLWHAYQRSPDGLSKALALGSGGALIAHLVHGMVSVAVLVAKPNIVFWIIVGLSAALYRTAGWPGSDTGSS